ncbi:MAG: helix-turn-helix transcriptional regulator [Firmicutes bacterium]|nr:helix-turn-helix transcriptional regulator [Bacillota bacterium]
MMQMIDKYKKYNPEFKAIICNNIKNFRKEKGMRLMDLAEILDISPEYLKRIESPNDEKKSCSLSLLYKISIILDKKLDDFLIDNRNS